MGRLGQYKHTQSPPELIAEIEDPFAQFVASRSSAFRRGSTSRSSTANSPWLTRMTASSAGRYMEVHEDAIRTTAGALFYVLADHK
jgi:hypothetical protein